MSATDACRVFDDRRVRRPPPRLAQVRPPPRRVGWEESARQRARGASRRGASHHGEIIMRCRLLPALLAAVLAAGPTSLRMRRGRDAHRRCCWSRRAVRCRTRWPSRSGGWRRSGWPPWAGRQPSVTTCSPRPGPGALRHRCGWPGGTRFETAIAISQRAFSGGAAEVFLARTDQFADAVAGGSLTSGPTLLVDSCNLVPAAIQDEVRRLAPARSPRWAARRPSATAR